MFLMRAFPLVIAVLVLPTGASGAPFTNRDSSSIVKYAAWSVTKQQEGGTWTPVSASGQSLSDCDAFRQGESPTHHICDGDRSKLLDATLEVCHHACIQDPSCSVVQWQGKRENGFSSQQLGACWILKTCDSAKVYSSRKSQDFCMDIARVTRTKGPEIAIGQVSKHPNNPLIVQDKPWDARWDNAYPNVEYSPGADGGAYQIWYDGCITCSGCDRGQGKNRTKAWHYANSSDGLSWNKPNLGIVDLAKISHATDEMKAAGTQNNLVMTPASGMGIYRDDRDSNASRLYKALGSGCYGEGGNTGCARGTGVSADGRHWTDSAPIHWPSPQRWDDHQNLFFDEVLGRWVVTTRDGFSGNPGRSIAIGLGSEDGSFGGWASPELTFEGNGDHQLYSQVTFQYYNIYLGIVMVFNTKDPKTVGTVQCRLAWSPSVQSGWRWVSPSGLTGEEIIPIDGAGSGAFDSNICFASKPLVVGDAVQLYYMGGNGPHNGPRNTSLGLATLRMDGFAGLRAGADSIEVETVPLPVAGGILVVTADVFPGGSACLGVIGEAGISVEDCMPITSNVTNFPVQFNGGKTLGGLVGSDVILQLALKNAMIYTFGFEKAEFLV